MQIDIFLLLNKTCCTSIEQEISIPENHPEARLRDIEPADQGEARDPHPETGAEEWSGVHWWLDTAEAGKDTKFFSAR